MALIGNLMLERLLADKLDPDRFASIPQAGEPFADELQKFFADWNAPPARIWLHKEVLEDGRRRITPEIEGFFQMDDTVLLIDDLITQADSKFEAIQALEEQGLKVSSRFGPGRPYAGRQRAA